MIDHLRKQHSIDPPNKPDEPKRAEYSILSFIKGKERLTHQQLLEKNILRWIVAEKQPFTTLESPAFQQIFLDIPGIRLPFTSRQVVRQRLADDFATQRVQLNEELSKTCKTIAISLDVWTSKNSLPILGIIGHWLTSEFQYQERALDFRELHGSHSGENLAAAVQATLEELHLERKLIAITGDNASNNEKMISVLYENLQKKVGSLRFRGLESYVRCLAHILNLIVKDILSALKSGTAAEAFSACDMLSRQDPRCLENQGVLAKLRILAVWIDRSPQRRQKWKEVCHFLDLPDKFIEYDNDTRWNSTYRMLADGLQAKVQINKYLEHSVELSLPSFTDNDWEWLRQIHGVLSKFNELTLFVSKKRPQISLSVAIYYELHDLLHDASEQRGSFSKLDMDIALAVKNGMKKYKKYYTFMDEVDTYYTALVLDPRVKGDLIRQELSEDDDAGRLILEAIRLELHREYNITEVNSPPTEQFLPDNHEYSDPELRMLRKLQPPSQSFASDIDRYFESPRAVVTDSKNPNWLCDWWRRHKDEYPQMAMAARDYLAIPASEVSVERMFNAGRDILGVRRFAMKGETMRMLMLMDSMEKNL